MKKLRLIWDLFLTPFYVTFIALASLVVLVSGGPYEFKSFWKRNC